MGWHSLAGICFLIDTGVGCQVGQSMKKINIENMMELCRLKY
jgi:hypothetical protein